jgi:excisionase family DNA binding protein
MTSREAAEYLRIHLKTLRDLVRDGKLQQVRLGWRTVRFRREDLDAFVESRIEVRKNATEEQR